jgi:hypothetical protein
MFRAIEIDDPEVGDTVIGSDIGRLADVDDALAVRRDLRIGSNLDRENIHGPQAIGIFLSDAGQRGKQKKEDDYGGERAECLRHGGLLSRMHVITKVRERFLSSSVGITNHSQYNHPVCRVPWTRPSPLTLPSNQSSDSKCTFSF